MAAVSGWAILSLACLLAGLGVALWGYELHQRQRQQMVRHLQTVLEQRMGAAAFLNPSAPDSEDGMAGLPWGPPWLRHAISWRWVWGGLSLSALLVLPLAVLGWERAALLLWCVLVGIGLLLVWRRWQRLRQQVQLQLPAFIDGMVRMVLLGHATPSAFLLASAAVKPPLLTTLEQAAAFAKAGMPVDQALAAASRHWGLEAFSLLAAILQVGGRFGGRVDSLLERVAHFMRDQQEAKQELHAMSAEVRLSAWVLSLLPLVVGGGIIVTNANYFMQLWTDTSGRQLLYAAAGLQVVGVCTLYRLAQLE
ncbi:MAG: type II secretion system F family protein [Comamonas sp.]